MTIDEYRDEILLKLGAPIVEVEIKDVVDKVVQSSFREVKKYIDVSKFMTIPYSECIDLSDKKVQAVHYITRDRGSGVNSNMVDAFYLATTQMDTSGNVSDYIRYLTIQQIKNTLSTDLDYTFIDNKLYVSCATPHPENITICYSPEYSSVEEVSDSFWEDIIMRVSIANSKIVLGRIRGKYTSSSALYNLDGEALLAEGNEELKEIRQYLSDNFDLALPLD